MHELFKHFQLDERISPVHNWIKYNNTI